MDELILENINSPQDLKKLPHEKLPVLAEKIRQLIIETVSKTGGHLAASLGTVELTIALHYVLNLPKDIIIWDVGHQAYTHKILTGRRSQFKMLRQFGGLSGFPNKDESIYDSFTVGHGSTSISMALGLAAARDLKKTDEKIVAVIGDGSLGGGMAFEALNHAGHLSKDLIIILNDNEFSIAKSVGAFSGYLNRIITNPIYNRIKTDIEALVKKVPRFGFRVFRAARRLEESLKNLLVPGMLFQELGIRYFGPIDGHNTNLLIHTFRNILMLKEPVLVHVVTKKGKGYELAEKNPTSFHGTAPFDIKTGEVKKSTQPTYTDIFSQTLIDLAMLDTRIVAITAAMPEGTGLDKFSTHFPDRFFNVGMAEQHAVSFAAGLAKSGLKPVVCIYSTFMQRSYDQIVHDVALQNLPVVLCVDRAGLVGEDGPTHHGIFDIAYLRHIPNLVNMAPADLKEFTSMLEFAVKFDGPVSIRYPRGAGVDLNMPGSGIQLGKAEILKEGKDLVVIALGSMVATSLEATEQLEKQGIGVTVVNARFITPLDKELIEKLSSKIKRIVTVEDSVICGGFGSSVLELIKDLGLEKIKLKLLGLPNEFVAHGKVELLYKSYGLDSEGIKKSIKEFLGNG